MKPWYESSTGNHQGLVIDEQTGRNIAVAYDKADARLIAAAPAMRAALKSLLAELPELWGERVHGGRIALALDEDAVHAALSALAAADKGAP